MPTRSVLVTGATGYLGRLLTSLLLERGHRVRGFVRDGSQNRAAPRLPVVIGNPFSVDDLAAAVTPADTLVHLIGTSRPRPRKAQEFMVATLLNAVERGADRVTVVEVPQIRAARIGGLRRARAR